MTVSCLRRLFVVFCVFLTQGAAAKPMRGPSIAATDPIAVRGGVLMVPLLAERAGTDWPASLELRAQDGERIQGIVA